MEFQPTPPARTETAVDPRHAEGGKFQPTPPARTETYLLQRQNKAYNISTHSAREDGDPFFLRCSLGYPNFNPLRPRGRRLNDDSSSTTIISFQPTPPARTETTTIWLHSHVIPISTHSAREDGDDAGSTGPADQPGFQPTPPARTETIMYPDYQDIPPISTHSAREDGDYGCGLSGNSLRYFNPLRPRGRRHQYRTMMSLQMQFQPTPPARTETKMPPAIDGKGEFQPTPPARTETRSTLLHSICMPDFNPLRPRGRRLPQCHLVPYAKPISTHSAREDGDWQLQYHTKTKMVISTHSAREDGDNTDGSIAYNLMQFQPTPPARTET